MPKVMAINILEDNYLTEVFERINRDKGLIGCLASHRLPDDNSPLSGVPVIDATLLYRRCNLQRAFAGIIPVALSADDLRQLYDCESMFMAAIDRTLPIPTSTRENQKFFHEIVGYYLAFFRKNPDLRIIFFDCVPHMPWDIALYFVAKKIGIKIIFIRRTLIKGYIVIDSDFTKPDCWLDKNIDPDCQNKSDKRTEDEIISFLSDMLVTKQDSSDKENKTMPFSILKLLRKVTAQAYRIQTIKELRVLISLLTTFKVPSAIEGATQLTKQNTILAGFGNISRIAYAKLHIRAMRFFNENQIYLDKYSEVKPDLNIKYIYYALHFQPERSTLPEGLEFKDQFLTLALLSEALPEGWKVYVKEHPRQTIFDMRKLNFRNIGDYEALSKYENITLIHPSFSSEELVNSCQLTATISGSAGWEGLLQGKPSLLFSPNWTAACESSAYVTSTDEVKNAIDKLSKKSRDDVLSDVTRFYKRIKCDLIHAAHHERSVDGFASREYSVNSLSSAIQGKIANIENLP